MIGYRTDDEKALADERKILMALLRQREDLEIRIAKQRRRVAAFAALVDESEETEVILALPSLEGLTEAIRTALKSASPHGLTAHGISVRLEQMCFPVREYTNFRASVNNVLKRLLKSGEIRKVEVVTATPGKRGDQSVYEWAIKFGKLSDLANPALYLQGILNSQPDELPKPQLRPGYERPKKVK